VLLAASLKYDHESGNKKLMGLMMQQFQKMGGFIFLWESCISRLRRYVLSSLNRRFKWGR